MWIEAVFTCSFCAHETRLTIATQSTVEGQPLTCPVCGGEMGLLSDAGTPLPAALPPKKPDEANQ
jgi:transcription elongation factor Elf1